MKIIRTQTDNFNFIKDFPYKENFISYKDINMHYIDEGRGEVILALHGEPTWSYLYRKFIPILKDYRFIAPDMIGFGKSDKMSKMKDYSFSFHFDSLVHFIETQGLENINLVVQDWGGLLGLSILGAYPEKFKSVIVLNTFLPNGDPLPSAFKTWQAYAKHYPFFKVSKLIQKVSYGTINQDALKAYDAPFKSRKHLAGARIFPSLVPGNPNDDGVKQMNQARDVLSKWDKPAIVLFSDKDRLLAKARGFFQELIPTTKDQQEVIIRDAGHFLQEEKGEEIAQYIDSFLKGKLRITT